MVVPNREHPWADSGAQEDSNYFPAPFKSIFLVRLINVSLASWQAELWYQPSISAGTSTSEKAERTPVAFS